jgi:hypothetical protein
VLFNTVVYPYTSPVVDFVIIQIDVSVPLIGVVTVTLREVRSATGLSPPLPPAPLLITGTWGVPSAPTIVQVTAYNSGAQVSSKAR